MSSSYEYSKVKLCGISVKHKDFDSYEQRPIVHLCESELMDNAHFPSGGR